MGHVNAMHLATIMSARVDDLARDCLVRQYAAFMINVLEEQIERGDALGEARLDLPPLSASDDARQQVVREDPLGALFTAVNIEGDSLIEEGKICCLLAPPQLIGRNRKQPAEQLSVVR